jgi:type II secretory pathway component PulF
MAESADPAEVAFDYNARDAAGGRKRGRIDARDRTEAARLLRMQGLYPIDITPATSEAPETALTQALKAGAAPARLNQRQRADMISRLAKLTGSKISLDRALSIMGDGRDGALPGAATALRMHMREGGGLLDGLRDHVGLTDPATLALVRGAEVSGDLPEALATAADILQQRLMLTRRIVTGLMYPSLLLVIAVLSIGLIMIAIIPQFRPLIEDRMDAVPMLGRVIFGLSAFLTAVWPILVASLAIGGFALWMLHRRGKALPVIARVTARLPMVRDIIKRNQVMVALHILSALLRRGVLLSEALRVVAATAASGPMREGLRAVTNQVESGEALSSALTQAKLVPTTAVEMVRIGEETGDLAGMTARAATEMREAADQALERFLALFQPALIVGVGLIVGVSLYALFSAIVAVNSIAF